MKKPDYKQAESLGLWMIIPGCIMLGFGASMEEARWLMYAGALLLIAGFVVMLAFCRCPHCGIYLGRNTNASFCPHCGEKLK